ncbi:FAD binding domain-containing protein [Nonomuraea lactucae]|uniref:FAD binding domain-containing protein n=1 Tax=Nonomuraea lactucae TaxID=2249762 RepID=UPI000DE44E33|nr:xanthine dehydrogenase family protein subunit M [Nonomuraea lactucae]
MKPLSYARPRTQAEAAALVRRSPDAVFIAGGTNLTDLMKLDVVTPDLLVDVQDLDLTELTHHEWGTVVGAGVTNAGLAGDIGIRRRYPLVSEAILAGASGQIRNAASIAGNLLQRTRCGYFQDVTKPCNKRSPGSGCPAIAGAHRELGVLGTSEHCVATHPSDMAVALAALDAVVRVRRATGSVSALTLDELYRLPGDRPDRDTTLEPGDLVTAVELPAPTGAPSRYRKVRDRTSFAFALVSVAAMLKVEDGVAVDVRLAYGGVAPRPWRARTAEAALLGERPTDSLITQALQAEFATARPLPDNAFKINLAASLTRAVVRDLAPAQKAGR